MDGLEAYGRGQADVPEQTTARESAMLGYALRLTRTPHAMRREDLTAMREAGLNDRAILETNQVTAYFAYANRVADGLGLELEPFFNEPESLG